MKRIVVLVTVAVALSAVTGCGGVRIAKPSDAYAPSAAARDQYETAIETAMGTAYMSSVADHSSFRTGVQDMGDVACKNAMNGRTRDDYQKDFRETGSAAKNTSSMSNEALDAWSLVFWSSAVQYLCPSVGTDKS
jgi:hypothetical protein